MQQLTNTGTSVVNLSVLLSGMKMSCRTHKALVLAWWLIVSNYLYTSLCAAHVPVWLIFKGSIISFRALIIRNYLRVTSNQRSTYGIITSWENIYTQFQTPGRESFTPKERLITILLRGPTALEWMRQGTTYFRGPFSLWQAQIILQSCINTKLIYKDTSVDKIWRG